MKLAFKKCENTQHAHQRRPNFRFSLHHYRIVHRSFLISGKIVDYTMEFETVDQVAISSDSLYVAAVVDKRSVYLLSSGGELIWTKSFKSWVDAVSVSGGDHAVVVAAERSYIYSASTVCRCGRRPSQTSWTQSSQVTVNTLWRWSPTRHLTTV